MHRPRSPTLAEATIEITLTTKNYLPSPTTTPLHSWRIARLLGRDVWDAIARNPVGTCR